MNTTDITSPPLDHHVISVLRTAVTELNLSARTYARIVIVARRIAEWAKAERVETRHVLDAIQFCTLAER